MALALQCLRTSCRRFLLELLYRAYTLPLPLLLLILILSSLAIKFGLSSMASQNIWKLSPWLAGEYKPTLDISRQP